MKSRFSVPVLWAMSAAVFFSFGLSATAQQHAQDARTAVAHTARFLGPAPAPVPREHDGRFIPGGRNVNAHNYIVSPGYPPIPDRAKFVGMLTGSWREMGIALGKRSGDRVRCTSDIWWNKVCVAKGKENTLAAMRLYERQISLLDPNQMEFLKGIAAGASAWLDQSVYAQSSHLMFADNYQRVLAASIWDCWAWGGPELPQPGCNSFAVLGAATTDGKTIATQSQHTPHDGLCYIQSYIIKPLEGNTVWTVAATPAVCGLMVVNDKGVSISHHFGGTTTERSRDHPEGPFHANAFGVPWWNLLLYAAVHCDTAEETIEALTIGSSEYRRRSGRKTVLRDGAWNWLVADRHTLAVVEASATRYAVRYAGEFTGSDWTDPNFIACANHFLCDFSYDDNGERTSVPMTIFNHNIENSEERFWTLMRDVRERYGTLDKYTAQHILSSTYIRHRDTGKRIRFAMDDDGVLQLHAHAKWGVQGGMRQEGREAGTNTAKVAVLDGPKSMVSWTLGNPSDWQGAWDEYFFDPTGQLDRKWWLRQ